MSNLILLTGAGFTMNFGGFSDEGIRKVIKIHLTDEEFKNIYQKIPRALKKETDS